MSSKVFFNLLNSFKRRLCSKYDYSTAKLMEKLDECLYDIHLLEKCPVSSDLDKETALLYYSQMNLIRKMELSIVQLYQKKLVWGFCHLYVGQEACAVGINSVLRAGDSVITSYRCHAWPLLMMEHVEDSVKGIVAELLGKKSGLSKGKGGSMHLYTDNFYGGHGIVGAHVPLGTGLAFAHKYNNDGGICFTIMGDGAVNNGQVQEAFNMAKLYNLPVIYVIENNKYGMGTSTARSSANQDFYKRGDIIPGIRVRSMDVAAVRDAARFAVDHVLVGNGPIILEIVTYRYYGHSMSDPDIAYRSRDEIKDYRAKNDPIKILSSKILSLGLSTEMELHDIQHKNKRIIENATEKALSEQEPIIQDMFKDICCEFNEDVRGVMLRVMQ